MYGFARNGHGNAVIARIEKLDSCWFNFIVLCFIDSACFARNGWKHGNCKSWKARFCRFYSIVLWRPAALLSMQVAINKWFLLKPEKIRRSFVLSFSRKTHKRTFNFEKIRTFNLKKLRP